MSWFEDHKDRKPGICQSFCYRVLRAGLIPQHVAIIMDGNRRFAKKTQITQKEGHLKGFDKLTEVLQWSFELGIPEVTVYAFSIENFKRSPEEVKTLTTLLKEKLDRLYEERDRVMEYGVCVRFLGDLEMFSEEIQRSAARIVMLSKDNNKSCLNIAVAYTSRHEISQAIKEVIGGIEEGKLMPSDINESLLERCLYTSKCRPVDMLIRTSGEVRLSDFLLWQSSHSLLCFVDVLWPEFSVWTLMTCILKYQLQVNSLRVAQEQSKLNESRRQLDADMRSAYEELSCRLPASASRHELDVHAKLVCERRKIRVAAFLESLERRREDLLERLLRTPDTLVAS